MLTLRTPVVVGFCAGACLASLAHAQTAPKMQFTARELFYAAAQAPKAAPVKPQQPAVAKKKSTPAPDVAQDSRPKRPANTPSGGSQIISAMAVEGATAPAPTAGPALGLKYTILKKVGEEMVEVPPSTVFRAGDRIQFSVQTNGPGYLYIVSQGSSGTWKPMFPSPELEGGNNRVDGWNSYAMPPNARFVFDEQTGTEKIFIVFSRGPEPDLEQMIYGLGTRNASPATVPAPKPKDVVTFAAVNIDDATVGRLRKTYARDLIVEKVTPQTPGEKKETAVYVVNPTGSNESRVVADLSLVHQ